MDYLPGTKMLEGLMSQAKKEAKRRGCDVTVIQSEFLAKVTRPSGPGRALSLACDAARLCLWRGVLRTRDWAVNAPKMLLAPCLAGLEADMAWSTLPVDPWQTLSKLLRANPLVCYDKNVPNFEGLLKLFKVLKVSF